MEIETFDGTAKASPLQINFFIQHEHQCILFHLPKRVRSQLLGILDIFPDRDLGSFGSFLPHTLFVSLSFTNGIYLGIAIGTRFIFSIRAQKPTMSDVFAHRFIA